MDHVYVIITETGICDGRGRPSCKLVWNKRGSTQQSKVIADTQPVTCHIVNLVEKLDVCLCWSSTEDATADYDAAIAFLQGRKAAAVAQYTKQKSTKPKRPRNSSTRRTNTRRTNTRPRDSSTRRKPVNDQVIAE